MAGKDTTGRKEYNCPVCRGVGLAVGLVRKVINLSPFPEDNHDYKLAWLECPMQQCNYAVVQVDELQRHLRMPYQIKKEVLGAWANGR